MHIEKFVLSYLKSPSIIKFYSSFQDKQKLYFLLELMPCGSLADLMKRECMLSVKLTRHIIAEIVLGLEFLRVNQIIHRDLKPGNVVFDRNYHCKLIDFATAKLMNEKLAARIPKTKVNS